MKESTRNPGSNPYIVGLEAELNEEGKVEVPD